MLFNSQTWGSYLAQQLKHNLGCLPTTYVAVPEFKYWLQSKFQLPANESPGRQQDVIKALGPLCPYVGPSFISRLLALAWSSPQL